MADHETSQAHLTLGIEMYEAKIKDKTITASEMGVYLKLLDKKGWDRVVSTPPARPLTADLPVDIEEEGEGSDRIIKFG